MNENFFMKRNRSFRSRMFRLLSPCAGLALLAASAGSCLACNIPVFRYALERWPVQPYVLTVFHTKPLTSEQQKKIAGLQNGNANIEVVDADLTASPDEQTLALWHAQHEPKQQPWAVLNLPLSTAPDGPGGGDGGAPGAPGDPGAGDQPAHAPDSPIVWAGRFDRLPTNFTDSPLRRQLASNILKGDSAEWVLIESGNRAKDDAAAKLLNSELKQEEQNITLVRPDPASGGPQLMSSIPLELKFSVLRVAKTSADELMFLKMLYACDITHLSWAQESATGDKAEPMVFVIFGRGRALPPIVGKQINADNIDQVSQFVSGACACEIKDLNPGTDLLTTTDWDSGLMIDASDAASTTQPAGPAAAHAPMPASVAIAPGLAAATPPPAALGSGRSRLDAIRPVLLAVVAFASLGLIVSGAVLLRSRSKPKIS